MLFIAGLCRTSARSGAATTGYGPARCRFGPIRVTHGVTSTDPCHELSHEDRYESRTGSRGPIRVTHRVTRSDPSHAPGHEDRSE